MDNDKYIGRLLDNRYEILEVIGTGGMAVVYKARCHRLNRLVAVKILKDDNLEDEDFRRRFHAESQAVAMLSHPNIVSVYDVSTSVMADYIVMELIEGITLKQYMAKKGILNWKETLHFAMQIAKALEHAHSKGIVHRDIKPHNIMVLKNGSVKVMDFGIARLISKGNTLTKEALGSVHYISPEQARGGRVDDRSDIYSLGVVMYEMMAGRPPYDGESPVAVAIQHINGGAALPSVLNPNIPGGLEQIIMKAMAHNVSDRYPSATRMLADMEEFRKDPTTLFDYTGLPLDAAMRIQKPPLTLQPQPETVTPKPAEPHTPPQRRTPPSSSGTTGRTGKPPQRRQPSPYSRQAAKQAKRTQVTTIAIIVCSLVAVIAIGVLLAVLLGGGCTPKSKLVEVPKFTGKVFSELPKYGGLTIQKEEEYSDTVAAGVIIRQIPEAGEKVDKNTPVVVVVYVSLGPTSSPITMNNMTGRSRTWAEDFLKGQKLDLKVEVIEESSDDIAKGYVIRTSPQEGAVLTQGQTITLWISKGKKSQIATMPNLVDKTKDEAVAFLKDMDMDLVFEIKEVYHESIAEGVVMETEPGAGQKLENGKTVTLTISKGIEKKMIRDLVGMEVNNAKGMLTKLGFPEPIIAYVASDQEKNTVVGQSLEKDKEYALTEVITLEVSDGSLVPVTKSVTIDLRNSASQFGCSVLVRRDNKDIYFTSVPVGTRAITLTNQTGIGIVKYEVIINGMDGWSEPVEFTAND